MNSLSYELVSLQGCLVLQPLKSMVLSDLRFLKLINVLTQNILKSNVWRLLLEFQRQYLASQTLEFFGCKFDYLLNSHFGKSLLQAFLEILSQVLFPGKLPVIQKVEHEE